MRLTPQMGPHRRANAGSGGEPGDLVAELGGGQGRGAAPLPWGPPASFVVWSIGRNRQASPAGSGRPGMKSPRKGWESPFDVRFLTSTNRDLATAVRERRLREDLLYRAQDLEVVVPPLCER